MKQFEPTDYDGHKKILQATQKLGDHGINHYRGVNIRQEVMKESSTVQGDR